MEISGHTILITGGGSGIGRGLAEAFHAAGSQVIVSGRGEAKLKETVAANPGMIYRLLDIEQPDAIRTFAAALLKDYPALDIVVHNAGVMVVEDFTSGTYELDVAETMITTNLMGPIRLTAALLPHLREQPGATIMTVSSGLAFVPLAITPTYCATKAAIHSWSQSLRHQLRDTSIAVIEIAPPAVATDLMPGHAANPSSMPLDAYIAETMAMLKADPTPVENCVQRVGMLRGAERGDYAKVFDMLNAPR